MRLVRLALQDFRNLGSVSLETDAPFVVFHGDNAQGKTNLLEAIYVLASLKSFRTQRSAELIRWGAEGAVVVGEVAEGPAQRRFEVRIDARGRRAQVDGKRPARQSDYFQGIRAVLFAPRDVDMVRGEPALRRRFVDRAAFTAWPAYLDLARDFRRVLDQKGAVLRSPRPDARQLDALDEQLAGLGARVVDRRRQVVAELAGPFAELHGSIAGGGQVGLSYRSCLGEGDVATLTAAYRRLLAERRQDALRRRQNTVGPQRDDLRLVLGERAARTYASQGQVRSLVLALKLAELQAARKRGARPIFLLDDLSSELDRARTARLVALLSELKLQCVATTTELGLLDAVPADQRVGFEVVGGRVDP